MASILSGREELKRLFASLTEHTFQVELGVADPPLVDYLVDMLVRFVRFDAIYKFRDTVGKRLEEVAEMLMEAEQREGQPKRELHRHIGDFTLFWTGVYPEALSSMKTFDRKDYLLDYFEQGKRSYLIASSFDSEPYQSESAVLRRLSRDFEYCMFGLNCVRREWEKLSNKTPSQNHSSEWN